MQHIAAQSISPSNIDVAEATKRGIPVSVVPPVTTEATADLTFGLMLAAARRMVEGDRLVRAGKFPGGQSRHLLGAIVHGKTLGLVGGGGLIGKAVAKRAHGFDMRVLYWTPRRKPESEERAAGLTYVPFDELLRESDFVSLHSPLNAQTRHQIGARELGLMKKTAFIVNTARGPIIDEKALVRALKAKKIAGAGLDVFEFEPKVSAELKKHEERRAQSASRQRHHRGARGDGEYRGRQYRGAARRPHAARLRQSGSVEESLSRFTPLPRLNAGVFFDAARVSTRPDPDRVDRGCLRRCSWASPACFPKVQPTASRFERAQSIDSWSVTVAMELFQRLYQPARLITASISTICWSE